MRAFVLAAALLVGLATPACAGDDVAAAQAVIQSQAEAFARDDAAAAYSYAAPSIRAMFPAPDAFMAMVRRGYAPVYRHKSFEFGEGHAADGKVALQVRIIDAEGLPWDAFYTLELQPDGSLKITGCILKAVGQAA
jgi:hypothetical protein